MRRFIITAITFLVSVSLAVAQDAPEKKRPSVRQAKVERDTLLYPDSFLDTVNVKKAFVLNDYVMVGVHYGVNFSSQIFNPSYSQQFRFVPGYYGITVSKYGKMFGYMPYFGLQVGLSKGHEGYKFKKNKDTGNTMTLEGATEVQYEVIEVPVMSAFHYDMQRFKLLGQLGFFGGYRTAIERMGELVDNPSTSYHQYKYEFKDTDRRWEYGMQGGLGFGIAFDPVEFHVNVKARWCWETLYDPDYLSKYYYRYANPLDIVVTAGVQFQLTKRTGKTRAALKKEAYNIVFPTESE